MLKLFIAKMLIGIVNEIFHVHIHICKLYLKENKN